MRVTALAERMAEQGFGYWPHVARLKKSVKIPLALAEITCQQKINLVEQEAYVQDHASELDALATGLAPRRERPSAAPSLWVAQESGAGASGRRAEPGFSASRPGLVVRHVPSPQTTFRDIAPAVGPGEWWR